MQETKSRREPVNPPPGYEHISMEMPLGGNEDLPPYPNPERKKVDANEKLEPSPQAIRREKVAAVAQQKSDNASHDLSVKPFPWWLVGLGTVIVGLAAWFFFKRRW